VKQKRYTGSALVGLIGVGEKGERPSTRPYRRNKKTVRESHEKRIKKRSPDNLLREAKKGFLNKTRHLG